jgi:hypothetical protein
MKKLCLILSVLSLSLIARENPFQSIISQSDINMSEAPNLPKPKYLTEESIKLPSSARFVRSVSVEYKNIDGSIGTETLQVHKDIDWHSPIVISHQALGNKKLVPPPNSESKESLDVFSFLKVDVYKTKVIVLTRDLKSRDFVLTSPSKIVLDFKGNDAPRSRLFKTNSGSVFKEVHVGKHEGFYRITLTLDGNYASKIEKREDGYLVEVR